MKLTLFTLLLLAAFSSSSFAAISDGQLKDFSFKYKWSGRVIEFTEKASTYEEAYEKVAMKCFRQLRSPGKMSEEQSLDLIDVCANPRS